MSTQERLHKCCKTLIESCNGTYTVDMLCCSLTDSLQCNFLLIAWQVLDHWFIPAICLSNVLDTVGWYVMCKPGSSRILIGLNNAIAARINLVRQQDGGEIFANDTAVIIHDGLQSSLMYQFTALSLLNRLERHDNMQRAKYKSTVLISSICHSIRTPLNTILHTARILSDIRTTASSELDQLYRASIVLANNMFDIADMAQLDLNCMQVHKTTFDIRELFNEVIAIIESQMASAILFTAAISRLVPQYIKSDRVRIKQILINLLENGLRRIDITDDTQHHLTIDIISEPTMAANFRHSIIVTIRDSGHPITAAVRNTMFRAPELLRSFAQYNSPKSEDQSALVLHADTNMRFNYLLAQRLDGALSIAPMLDANDVTCIIFEFMTDDMCLQPTLFKSLRPLGPANSERARSSISTLIVEDDQANRTLLEQILRYKGYTSIISVENAAQALRLISATTFDLIISDIRMPGMTGFELIQKIRELCAVQRVTAPMLFGMTAQMLINTPCGGFDVMISKPIDTDELDKKICLAFH